jgi:hypothetical protein
MLSLLKTAELLGADAALRKPIDGRELLRTLRDLLTERGCGIQMSANRPELQFLTEAQRTRRTRNLLLCGLCFSVRNL